MSNLTKRTGACLLALLGCLFLLGGCQKSEGKDTPDAQPTVTAVPTAAPEAAADTDLEEFAMLNQEQITKVMGAGWNLGNQLEAVVNQTPGETNWGNPVITADTIKMIKDARFTTIRVPVTYMSHIGPAPDYTIDPAWLDRIQEVVDLCMANKLYTIINMHGDGYHTIDGGWLFCDDSDQKTIKEKYQAVWAQIADRFKDYDEHLIFESMNEEFDGNYNGPSAAFYQNINDYNQIFTDTVRQSGGNNDKRWLLIPGWNTDITYTNAASGFVLPTDTYLSKDVPAGEKRHMVSVHYYSPWDFCGGETGTITQWGADVTDSAKESSHSGENYLAKCISQLKTDFVDQGYPVVIGEYSTNDKSSFDPENTYFRSYFTKKVCEKCKQNGIIPVYWDNGHNGEYGMAIFDRKNLIVSQPTILAAIMDVYYPSVSGTSQSIALSNDTLEVALGGEGTVITASLIPADSQDTIQWSSSDETVAIVSSNGKVIPYESGTTVITATANGHSASCTVTVGQSQSVFIDLYALETKSWSSITSTQKQELTADGQTITFTMTGGTDLLSNIGSLYLKDVLVQGNTASESAFKSAKITIDSVSFNGTDLKVLSSKEEAITGAGAFDYCLLNQWVENSEKIDHVQKNANGSYEFTGIDYQDTNTIIVTVTVMDVVLR